MKMKTVVMIFLMILSFALPLVHADEAALEGVAGCSSVKINPDLSLEDQQSICNYAEHDSATSCAASGHGTCSSPKLDGTLPDADHCVCVGESTEVASEAVPEVIPEEPAA